MIKLDLLRMLNDYIGPHHWMYDYIWFGWYCQYDYGRSKKTVWWQYDKPCRWKPMVKRNGGGQWP